MRDVHIMVEVELMRSDGNYGRDRAGEWEEWTGYAYHVRRRLTPTEQRDIGEAIDIRGTAEAHRRLARVLEYAQRSPQGLAVLTMEASAPESAA